MIKTVALVGLLALVALAALACGDQNQVGSQKLLRIPTPSPVRSSPTPSPSPQHVASQPPVQHTSQPPPPPVQQTVTVDVITNSPYLTPQNLSVAHGTVVKFVNQDQQPDKIEIQDSAGVAVATSTSIAPGGTWSYTFANRGSYVIADRRPYATDPVNVT